MLNKYNAFSYGKAKEVQMNQREQIIKYIEDFGSITSYQAYVDLGITQLASRLKELKEEGSQFNYTWITKKNRYGKPIRFKKSTLEGGIESVSSNDRRYYMFGNNRFNDNRIHSPMGM